VYVSHVSSTLAFSLSSYRLIHKFCLYLSISRFVINNKDVLRVGLGVGGAVITSESCTRPTHSCDRWVCDLGSVGVSSVFG
jgi:hypothetical protein